MRASRELKCPCWNGQGTSDALHTCAWHESTACSLLVGSSLDVAEHRATPSDPLCRPVCEPLLHAYQQLGGENNLHSFPLCLLCLLSCGLCSPCGQSSRPTCNRNPKHRACKCLTEGRCNSFELLRPSTFGTVWLSRCSLLLGKGELWQLRHRSRLWSVPTSWTRQRKATKKTRATVIGTMFHGGACSCFSLAGLFILCTF